VFRVNGLQWNVLLLIAGGWLLQAVVAELWQTLDGLAVDLQYTTEGCCQGCTRGCLPARNIFACYIQPSTFTHLLFVIGLLCMLKGDCIIILMVTISLSPLVLQVLFI
jgi:hypothetical protein